MKLHRVEVVSREPFSECLLLSYRYTGEHPEPGQFVVARATEPSASTDPLLNRPFFIHDYEDGVATLFFEARGRGTALLAQAEAEIFVSDPLGRGFVLFDTGPVALVGEGAGASPLRLASKRLAQLHVPHDVYLVLPSYQRVNRDRFQGLFPQARTVWSGADVPGFRQHLDSLSGYAAVYASGPGELLSEVREAASDIPCQLALQERMACANGSCHGCAVPVWESGARTYARACVEGPVFPAEALAW